MYVSIHERVPGIVLHLITKIQNLLANSEVLTVGFGTCVVSLL